LESGRLGRMFAKTFGYYVLSSLLAILIGLAFVNLIHPGRGANLVDAAKVEAMGRLGGPNYTRVTAESIFAMPRPVLPGG